MARNPFRDLTAYFIFLLLTATIGPLLFGYHLAELNAPQDVITCVKKSLEASTLEHVRSVFSSSPAETRSLEGLPQCIPMSSGQFGLVSSVFTLGGLIGALSSGPMAAKYGRLRSMLFNTVFFTIGPLISALAPSVAVMSAGRFVSGLGAGAAVVVVPIFISEVAPPEEKGFFGSFTQVMINFGIFITQLLGYFLSQGQLWRIIIAAAGAIGLLQTVCLAVGGQESPKWMADHGKPSRAKRVLRKLRGHHVDIKEEVIGWGCESERDMDDEEETLLANEDHMHENPDTGAPVNANSASNDDHDNNSIMSASRQAAASTKRQTLGVLAVLTNRQYSPAVFAVMMTMIAQQLLGINSIVMYGVSLLSSLLGANSALLNIFVSLLNMFVTLAAAPLIDYLGRKSCLLLSIAGMGTSSVLLGIGIMQHIAPLSVISVITFVASFGLGLGPVPFILSSELTGPEAVGATQSWALAANWVATFVVAQFFPIVNEKLGAGQVYFIFAGFAVLFGGLTAKFVPETKGKADVDEVWGRKKEGRRED